jgi:hypothetical protein
MGIAARGHKDRKRRIETGKLKKKMGTAPETLRAGLSPANDSEEPRAEKGLTAAKRSERSRPRTGKETQWSRGLAGGGDGNGMAAGKIQGKSSTTNEQ